EVAGRMRRAIAIHAVELAAPREPTALRRRHLGGEALPTFAPATRKDGAATAGAHAGAETVGLRPLPLLGLISALHCRREYRDTGEIFSPPIAGGRVPSANDGAIVAAPRARRLPYDRPRSPLASDPGEAGEIGPGVDLPALAGAAGSGRGRFRDDLPEGTRGDPGLGRAALLGADRGRPLRGGHRLAAGQLRRAARGRRSHGPRTRPESQLHLRAIRHRSRQPPCPRRRTGRRRGPLGGLQPALPPRTAGPRQDPPAGGDR